MEKVTQGMLVLFFFREGEREMGLRERDGEKGREREEDGKQTA